MRRPRIWPTFDDPSRYTTYRQNRRAAYLPQTVSGPLDLVAMRAPVVDEFPRAFAVAWWTRLIAWFRGLLS